MDNQEFRGILLKLQDRLSDNDRKRLHFFFGNDVPRRIRDDPSLGGTLSLMESLFDQDKINEQDFTVLINAFIEIKCIDAAKLLQAQMQQIQKNDHKAPLERLSSILPNASDQLFQDLEVDKFNIKSNFAYEEKEPIHTKINPITFVVNHHACSNSLSTEKNYLTSSSIIQMCLVLFTIVSIIILAVLTGFYIHRTSRINQLEKDLEITRNVVIYEQIKNNQTIKTNKILNNTINDLEKERNSSFTRAGTKFGGIGGGPFDDSIRSNFTCSHYLRGIVGRAGFYHSDWYQFLYSSYESDNIIEGTIHGTRSENDISERFLLVKNEKIIKVQVLCLNTTYIISGILQTIPMVRGLRFFTTNGRASPSLDHADGKLDTEQFDGYSLGYISGRDGLAIDQIQFHWYRMPTK